MFREVYIDEYSTLGEAIPHTLCHIHSTFSLDLSMVYDLGLAPRFSLIQKDENMLQYASDALRADRDFILKASADSSFSPPWR